MKTKISKPPAARSAPAKRNPAAATAPAATNKPWGEYMQGVLQDDAEAAAYLEAAIDEGDPSGLMIALRRLADARGGIATIAERTGLSRETLYRTLSERGNPRLSSLSAILQATGLKLAIAPASECAAG